MIMQAVLLNSGATLNDYFVVEAVNFIPGQNLTIAIQVRDAERSIRYVPPSAATLSMSFIDSSGNTVLKTASVINADDRSMWAVSLSQAETETLAGQNIIVSLDVNGDGTVILLALVANGVIRINLSGDC